jgi:hypothetical protein
VKTIRTGKVGDLSLRLVEKDHVFIGLIFAADGAKKAQIEGADADDMWRCLHDEAGKANPKYFGFDGARARFLKFFPNGLDSAGYANAERDYKIAAKAKLDATALSSMQSARPASAKRSFPYSARRICCLLSRRFAFRTCCADRRRTLSSAPPPASHWATENLRSWKWSVC